MKRHSRGIRKWRRRSSGAATIRTATFAFPTSSLARERENSFRSAVGLSPMVIIVHDQSFFLPSAEQRKCNDNN